MSNDLIKAGADLLISQGETKRHAKKLMFEDYYELLKEIEMRVYNLIEGTWRFFDEIPSDEKTVSVAYQEVVRDYELLKNLVGQNKSRISDAMYMILFDIEVETFRQINMGERLFFIKTGKLDALHEAFIKQLKNDRKALVKGKIE